MRTEAQILERMEELKHKLQNDDLNPFSIDSHDIEQELHVLGWVLYAGVKE